MLRRSLLKNLHAQPNIGVSLVAFMTQSRYIYYIKVEQYFFVFVQYLNTCKGKECLKGKALASHVRSCQSVTFYSTKIFCLLGACLLSNSS